MRLAVMTAVLALSLLAQVLSGSPARADKLPEPTGPTILEVTGNIEHTNSPGSARFDAKMLGELETIEIQTQTPWTDGDVVFEGPLTRDVMALVGAQGSRVLAVALNNYSVEIPMSDFTSIDSIFATRLNGETIGVRNRGPIWIIFPWNESPELRNELYYSRSIWQLRSITVIEE